MKPNSSASGRTRTVILSVSMGILLILAALLSLALAGHRGDLRRRTAEVVADSESAEAEWRAIDKNKQDVWQARRKEAEEAADELKAQLDDSESSANRTRDQVEVLEGYIIREQKADLGIALLDAAEAFLKGSASWSVEASE